MSDILGRDQVFLLLGQTGWRAPNWDAFKNNGIAVDPPGCGCTDCIVGDSIPEDRLTAETLLTALALDRPVYDRRY